jgi:Type IIA topoisomerase (DNA gyrase/topo II, topoisomerase IV), A subunit
MKTVVEIDYKWALTTCLRYARRQVLMLQAFREKGITLEEVFEFIANSSDEEKLREKIEQRFFVAPAVAREMLELPLARYSTFDPEKDIVYFEKASSVLSDLLKNNPE